MSAFVITADCNACHATVPISDLVQAGDGYDCPRCGEPFYWEPDNMVERACDECGRMTRVFADDDGSRGTMCDPCVRTLLSAL